MNIKWLVKISIFMPFQRSSNSYSFCIIAKKNIPKPKINWLFFRANFSIRSFRGGCIFLYSVWLACHTRHPYYYSLSCTWKMNLFLVQIFMSAFGHTNNLWEDCWDMDDMNICTWTNFSNSLCLLCCCFSVCLVRRT